MIKVVYVKFRQGEKGKRSSQTLSDDKTEGFINLLEKSLR